MTRVARHPSSSREAVGIQCGHHLDHLSRLLFRFLIVLLKRVFNVAMIAVDPKRRCHELHRRDQLIGGYLFHYLDVFIRHARGLGEGSKGQRDESANKTER